jgi:spermidine synthase
MMNPWVLLDSTVVPGDGGEMKLYQRAHEFSISVKREELMNSRMHGSEEALAELACKRLAGHTAPCVLIGGLGMGFTLRAALDNLRPDARVLIAELVPSVVQWNRTHLSELAQRPLEDARVEVREADVAVVMQHEKEAFDAIMLDVDNGPDGLTHQGNDRLYTHGGLSVAKAALKKGGMLAVWSAEPDKAFTKRLVGAGFRVEEVTVRARGTKGRRHTIWLAEKG